MTDETPAKAGHKDTLSGRWRVVQSSKTNEHGRYSKKQADIPQCPAQCEGVDSRLAAWRPGLRRLGLCTTRPIATPTDATFDIGEARYRRGELYRTERIRLLLPRLEPLSASRHLARHYLATPPAPVLAAVAPTSRRADDLNPSDSDVAPREFEMRRLDERGAALPEAP
eukprot:7380369-Prymnesium_polylepis.1